MWPRLRPSARLPASTAICRRRVCSRTTPERPRLFNFPAAKTTAARSATNKAGRAAFLYPFFIIFDQKSAAQRQVCASSGHSRFHNVRRERRNGFYQQPLWHGARHRSCCLVRFSSRSLAMRSAVSRSRASASGTAGVFLMGAALRLSVHAARPAKYPHSVEVLHRRQRIHCRHEL